MFHISLLHILVIIIYSNLLLVPSFFIFGAKLPKASRELLSVIDIQGKLRYFYSLLIVTSSNTRSSHPEVFSRKGVLKKCSRFTGEHPCRSAISIKLLYTSVWVFSRKFAAYFQNTFLQEHLWMAASVRRN